MQVLDKVTTIVSRLSEQRPGGGGHMRRGVRPLVERGDNGAAPARSGLMGNTILFHPGVHPRWRSSQPTPW
jgi:hypothetical protein